MTAEEAHDIIKTRYNELSQITDYITKRINRKIIKFLQYFHIIRAIHKHLYNGILINAGEFRKEDDKHGGRVHFGGMQHTEMKAYFDGFPPNIL
ncbi:MAG: hypothetical protein U9Q91_01445, partial [Candidatus Marinimicrobia bacterium]|nr:hypothetical protein [Candidatus Neomarinimicrobiota bacterium]